MKEEKITKKVQDLCYGNGNTTERNEWREKQTERRSDSYFVLNSIIL